MSVLSEALDEFIRRGEITLRNGADALLISDHPVALLRTWTGTVLTADRRVVHAGVTTSLPPRFTTTETVVCLSALSDIARWQVDTALAVTNGTIIVIAENRRGAERIAALIGKESHPEMQTLSRSHCRAVVTAHATGNTAADGAALPVLPARTVLGWEDMQALPGVFSAERADRGTELLRGCVIARVREDASIRSALDLGCGCGILGITAQETALRAGAAPLQVDFVDVDYRAIQSVALNLTARGLPHGSLCWLDATRSPLPRSRYDLVLLNPPFHAHGDEQRELGRKLIDVALSVTEGELLVVGNTHLGYGAFFKEKSLPTTEICTDKQFTVWSARSRVAATRRHKASA